jgi:carbamoyltransferase
MTKPIYILGTGLSHDGSSCLMRNGEIVVGVEKERLTRKKHDGFNDKLTLEYCLETEGITWRDIDLLVENNTKNRFELEDQRRRLGREIPDFVPQINIPHHLAHAYSAIGTSAFLDATVVVIDGRGSSLDNCFDAAPQVIPSEVSDVPVDCRDEWFEKVSIYAFRNGRMETVFKDFSRLTSPNIDRTQFPLAPPSMEHSLGEFYGGVSRYVFNKDFQMGKLMGLAPYGRPNMFPNEGFVLRDGRAFINYDSLPRVPLELDGKFYERPDCFQVYADLAYWAQKELEEALLYLFKTARELTRSRNVAYAGGVALNAVGNRRLLQESSFENFYFQPAAADNGLAIGCCYYGWLEVLKKSSVRHTGMSAFGRIYDTEQCSQAIASLGVEFSVAEPKDIITATAQLLADGKTVGWFQGPSEFGPRALGHRSILADPRRAEMKDFINGRVKLREEFRPFAPSVAEADSPAYFKGNYDSPYMILVMDVNPEWRDRLPAVVHRDGTARVQTVSERLNPRYYQLLKEFERIAGIPILLNTSFNRRGMPIVETPAEAVKFFAESALHALVIDKYQIIKNK